MFKIYYVGAQSQYLIYYSMQYFNLYYYKKYLAKFKRHRLGGNGISFHSRRDNVSFKRA